MINNGLTAPGTDSIKPKILILGPLPPPYMGPSIATDILIKSKLNEKYRIVHLNTNTHKSLSTLGIWTCYRILNYFTLYLKLISLLKKHKPDLVLIPISQTTTGFLKDSLFILISYFFNVKIILHLRGSNFRNWLNNTKFILKNITIYLLKLSDGIIVLGKNLTYLFEDIFPSKKIFVVPNGADLSIQPDFNENSLPIKIIYLSNLQASKGIEDIIESAKHLERYHPNLDFKIDVFGEWRDKFTQIRCLYSVKKNNLPIIFHRPVYSKNKLEILKNSDIFVFPPREPEGHPWVIVEAMAAGLPIISTDQGAISESVIDGYNGFIVDKCNPKQIAEKIKYLVENPELRKKMGKNSRILYLEKFTEEKMLQKLSYTIDAVLKG